MFSKDDSSNEHSSCFDPVDGVWSDDDSAALSLPFSGLREALLCGTLKSSLDALSCSVSSLCWNAMGCSGRVYGVTTGCFPFVVGYFAGGEYFDFMICIVFGGG